MCDPYCFSIWILGPAAGPEWQNSFSRLITVCVFLVAVAFSVYAVVLFGLLWRFNVSVVSSVCCGVCLFVIVGGVCLLWHFLVCCGIVRFAVLFFGLLSRFSVCCNVFRSACAMFPFVRQQFKNSTSPTYTPHSGLEI